MPAFTVSILSEIPEDLHESLRNYLKNHPDWDQDRVYRAALSLFLMQDEQSLENDNSANYRKAARIYLDALFGTENV